MLITLSNSKMRLYKNSLHDTAVEESISGENFFNAIFASKNYFGLRYYMRDDIIIKIST